MRRWTPYASCKQWTLRADLKEEMVGSRVAKEGRALQMARVIDFEKKRALRR